MVWCGVVCGVFLVLDSYTHKTRAHTHKTHTTTTFAVLWKRGRNQITHTYPHTHNKQHTT
jgi:hypothetical protein